MFIIAASIGIVAAALITLNRVVGWRSMAKHATIIDVGFSVGVGVAFMGTLTGMLVAIIAGLVMAVTLNMLRQADKRTKPSAACDPKSEFNADGTWKYNCAPYV